MCEARCAQDRNNRQVGPRRLDQTGNQSSSAERCRGDNTSSEAGVLGVSTGRMISSSLVETEPYSLVVVEGGDVLEGTDVSESPMIDVVRC